MCRNKTKVTNGCSETNMVGRKCNENSRESEREEKGKEERGKERRKRKRKRRVRGRQKAVKLLVGQREQKGKNDEQRQDRQNKECGRRDVQKRGKR